MRHPSLAGAQGFTLIELLVALTLTGLLSVILFGGLRFGVRAWEAGGDHVDRVSRIEVVQSLLRRQLAQTRLPPLEANASGAAVFVGEPGRLFFVASLPAHHGIGGSYMFRLGDSEHDGRSDLTLAWRLYRPELLASDAPVLEDGTTLLEDITGIELSYFGAPDPERAPQWWAAWDGVNGAPQLVRVRVEFPPGDSRRWPDLIVRVIGSAR